MGIDKFSDSDPREQRYDEFWSMVAGPYDKFSKLHAFRSRRRRKLIPMDGAKNSMNTLTLLSIVLVIVSLTAISGCGGNGVSDPADGRVILFQDGFEAYQAGASLPRADGAWKYLPLGDNVFPILDAKSMVSPFEGNKVLSLFAPTVDQIWVDYQSWQEVPKEAKIAGATARFFCPADVQGGTAILQLTTVSKTFYLDFAKETISSGLGFDTPSDPVPWNSPRGRWVEFALKFTYSAGPVEPSVIEVFVDGQPIDRQEVVPATFEGIRPTFVLGLGSVQLGSHPAQNILMDKFEAWFMR